MSRDGTGRDGSAGGTHHRRHASKQVSKRCKNFKTCRYLFKWFTGTYSSKLFWLILAKYTFECEKWWQSRDKQATKRFTCIYQNVKRINIYFVLLTQPSHLSHPCMFHDTPWWYWWWEQWRWRHVILSSHVLKCFVMSAYQPTLSSVGV